MLLLYLLRNKLPELRETPAFQFGRARAVLFDRAPEGAGRLPSERWSNLTSRL